VTDGVPLPRACRLAEEVLVGGTANRGCVVRVGDTVRRPLHTGSAGAHALLRNLEAVGFDGAPRLLGIDDEGREVLTYVEGETLIPPYQPLSLTDDALASVASLLRDFHDAAQGVDWSAYRWQVAVPERFGGPGICHDDPNLDNVVFRHDRAVALIDFDFAAPAARMWDVANAARLSAPVRPNTEVYDARRGRTLHRFRRFVDAYNLSDDERAEVVDGAVVTHDWCCDVVRTGAANGNVNFADYWHRIGRRRAAVMRAWYDRHGDTLRRALD